MHMIVLIFLVPGGERLQRTRVRIKEEEEEKENMCALLFLLHGGEEK